MGGTTEGIVIGKDDFFLYLSCRFHFHTIGYCCSYHNDYNYDRSRWIISWKLNFICGFLPWRDNNSPDDCMYHESSSRIFSKIIPCFYYFHHYCCCHFHHLYWCCWTDSSYVPLVSAFVAFSAEVEVTFVGTGWFYLPFQLEYPQYPPLLAARHCQDLLPLVIQYFLIGNLHPPQFHQQHTSIPDGKYKKLVCMHPKFCQFVSLLFHS